MNEPKITGYQPTQTLDPLTPPSSGPAYTPLRKSTSEAVQDLLDANIMLMSVIDQLHTRIQNLESDMRQANTKISRLEQRIGGEA